MLAEMRINNEKAAEFVCEDICGNVIFLKTSHQSLMDSLAEYAIYFHLEISNPLSRTILS